MTDQPIDPVTLDPPEPEPEPEVNRFDITDEGLANDDDQVAEAVRSVLNVCHLVTDNVTPDRLHAIMLKKVPLRALAHLAAALSTVQSVASISLATKLADELGKRDAVEALNELLERAKALGLDVPDPRPKANA